MPHSRFELAALLFCAGCSARPPVAAGPSVALRVASLDLPAIHYACYDVAITGPSGPVWQAGTPGLSWLDGDADTLCSWQYGNGRDGDIGYVAPCDADDGDGDSPAEASNTITLWFDGLYLDPDGDHDPAEDDDIGDWQDPCPAGCSVTALCRENADTPVVLEFTVLRQAVQGFFDIAVNFADIFCSAKLDCRPALLHDPATGERGPTAVIAFACTSGQIGEGLSQPTHLHLDDFRVECTGPPAKTYYIDPTLGPGNIGGQGPGLFEIATYPGSETLPGYEKCYWNTAIGLDLETLADPGVLGPGCTLHGRGTASDKPFVSGNTPAGTVYPVVTWAVPLTGIGGVLECESHPLNGSPPGVATGYTDFAGEHFGCTMNCATGELSCPGRVSCPPTPLGLDSPVALTQQTGSDGQSSLLAFTFEGGATHTIPMPGGLTVTGCCADSCCLAGVPQ